MARDTRKTLKRREIKNEKYKQSLTMQQRKQNSLVLFFVYGKGYILLGNIVWENVVDIITFLVKFFLVLQDICNEVMEHQRPYRSALVLQMLYFDLKYLEIEWVF